LKEYEGKQRSRKDRQTCLWEGVICSFFVLFLCSILIVISAHVAGAGSDNKVLVLKISGVITPASDDVLANAIAKAETEGFEALVI
jgi:membrane-bound serine protease (ClpP class)